MSSGKRLGSGFQPTTPYSNAPYDPLHDNDGTGYLNPTFSGSTQPHPEQGYTSPFGHHAGPSSSPILPRLGSAGSQVRPRPLGQHSFSSPVPATRSSPGASTGIHGGPSRNSAHVSEPQVESLIDKLRKSQANLWQQFSDAGDLQAQRNDHYEGRIKELMDSVARLTDPTTGAVTSNDLASQLASFGSRLAIDMIPPRQDLASLRTDIKAIRPDISVFRTDINTVRSDINSLRTDVKAQHDGVIKALEFGESNVLARIDSLAGGVGEELEGIRNSIQSRHDRLITEFGSVEHRAKDRADHLGSVLNKMKEDVANVAKKPNVTAEKYEALASTLQAQADVATLRYNERKAYEEETRRFVLGCLGSIFLVFVLLLLRK